MEPTDLVLVLVAAAVLLLLAAWVGRHEAAKRRVTCPRTGTNADIDVVQHYGKTDEPVRVKSCSVLPNPGHVDCEQDCLNPTAHQP